MIIGNPVGNIIGSSARGPAVSGIPVIEGWEMTTSVGAVNSLDVVKPAGIVAGELLMVIGMVDANEVVTATYPGFTLALEEWANTAAYGVFLRTATGSDTNLAFATDGTITDMVFWYLRISGADVSGLDSSVKSSQSSGDTITVTQTTTTVANCLAFYGVAYDGGDGLPYSTVSAGWTEGAEGQNGIGATNMSGCWGTKEMAVAGVTGAVVVTATGSNDGSTNFQLSIAPTPL